MEVPPFPSADRNEATVQEVDDSSGLQKCRDLFMNIPEKLRNRYYGAPHPSSSERDATKQLVDMIIDICGPGPIQEEMKKASMSDADAVSAIDVKEVHKLFVMDKKVEKVFRDYKHRFPASVWRCCTQFCFTKLAVKEENFIAFSEVLRIKEVVEGLHEQVDACKFLVQTRRKGIGGSGFAYFSDTRSEREASSGQLSTDRHEACREVEKFVSDALPFLYGRRYSPSGSVKLGEKLCTTAICCILGVSVNYLYARKKGEGQLMRSSLLDSLGLRMRQLRRQENRGSFPSIFQLPNYDCGCEEPCFAGVGVGRLHCLYKEFAALSREAQPRRREMQYLLNIMFCPLSNSTVRTCNEALSALFTVSVEVVANVRRTLDVMIRDPSIKDSSVLSQGVSVYTSSPLHPANRYSDEIRENVETHLDIVLRADPAASDGVQVYRVYSPEINTYEKLQNSISMYLENDEGLDIALSSSTLQRMINDYLKSRGSKIKFLQSDHNACPSCKTLQYVLLQWSYDIKRLKCKLQSMERNPLQQNHAELREVKSALEDKSAQEKIALKDLEDHNYRDASIRKWLKRVIDHFRNIEREYTELERVCVTGWRKRPDHAMLTHQDDMSKVDLPSFIVNASSDITRWRYDINAHVNAVTDEAFVYSHEQGCGAKSSSVIMEMILLDHILRCKGEGIKIIVSDNASVGKNWLTCVAMPQYFVDQGLADIVFVVFLENNHGKWLADQLFGQFQIRKRHSTILGIDGMLREFETIRRKGSGCVQGFAVNPLSGVDFVKVLASLGYQTKPPKEVGFTKRNIHFASACAPFAKDRLPVTARKFFQDLLPSEQGMVHRMRLCSEPPSSKSQSELPYESRYFDVPAANLEGLLGRGQNDSSVMTGRGSGFLCEAPLTVARNQPFASAGSCVVSSRNMKVVGYNGLRFRKLQSCPELQNDNDRVVREAWPRGLRELGHSAELLTGSESVKCAPENWIVRRPSSHFKEGGGEIVSRYPPRNMLNALYEKPPRHAEGWIPTATYYEPPVALMEERSTFHALKRFAEQNYPSGESVSVLDLLQCVYTEMEGRDHVQDRWKQRSVTIPTAAAIQKYRVEMGVFNAREEGHPNSPLTLQRAFKMDAQVDEQARRMLAQNRNRQETLAKIKSRLFAEAEKRPGELEKFRYIVEKDLERYAKEVKTFREGRQRQFDEVHGLLPRQPAYLDRG